MKRSSGENAPIARSSRSQMDRAEIWIDGSWEAYSFNSARSRGLSTMRLTSFEPYGAINGEELSDCTCGDCELRSRRSIPPSSDALLSRRGSRLPFEHPDNMTDSGRSEV